MSTDVKFECSACGTSHPSPGKDIRDELASEERKKLLAAWLDAEERYERNPENVQLAHNALLSSIRYFSTFSTNTWLFPTTLVSKRGKHDRHFVVCREQCKFTADRGITGP